MMKADASLNLLSAIPGLLLFVWCLVPLTAFGQDSPNRSIRYFQRLEFDSLTIDELHSRLSRQASSPESREIATRLRDEYVQQFLEGGPNQPDFVWDPDRMQRMADDWPDLASPAWRLAVLAARLQSTDRDFSAWQNHQDGGGLRMQVAREMELLLRSIENELNGIDIGDQTGMASEIDRGLIRFRGTLLLANISMRLILLGAADENANHSAVRALQQILRLDPDPQISSNQLDGLVPASEWQVRALESLAICRLRSQSGDVGRVMSAIERFGTPADHLISSIRVLSGSGQYEAIDRLLAELDDPVKVAGPMNSTDQSRVWLAALQAGRQTPPEMPGVRSAILWRSLRELAMADERLLPQSLQDWKPEEIPAAPDRFTESWIQGARGLGQYWIQEHADRARLTNALPRYLQTQATTEPVDSTNAGSVDALATARKVIENGLAQSDSNVRPDYRAAFLLTVSAMDCQLGNWASAAPQAKTVLDMKFELRPGQVQRAARLLLQARVQLAAGDPSSQLLLREESLEIANRFPGQPVGEMANLQSMIVENRQRPAEQGIAIWQQYLQQFPANEIAQVELLTRLTEVAADRSNSRQQESLDQAIAIARSILNSETASVATRVWAVSGVVNAMHGVGDQIPNNEAADLLNSLERLIATPDLSLEERGQATFAAMRLGELTGNERVRQKAMAWIIANPNSGPWYAAALRVQAQQLDAKWKMAEPGSTDFEMLLNVYQSLFDDAGSDVDAIRRDPDIRLIASRLADLHDRQGQNRPAEVLYDLILQAYPNDRDILLAAARSNIANGDFDQGAARWRRLAQFFPAGSELWRESRYNLYACLLNSNRDDAETVRKQTFELDPEMPDEWKRRY